MDAGKIGGGLQSSLTLAVRVQSSKELVSHEGFPLGFVGTVKGVIVARKRSRRANEPLPEQPPSTARWTARARPLSQCVMIRYVIRYDAIYDAVVSYRIVSYRVWWGAGRSVCAHL